MTIEAMKQALEHVQEFKRRWWAVPPFGNKVNKATREAVSAAHSPIFQLEDTIRAAIEKAELMQRAEEAFAASEQKPVAWMDAITREIYWRDQPTDVPNIPLYTAPRQWVGLTDDEVMKTWNRVSKESVVHIKNFARAIEAKLKDRNQ